MKRQPFNLDREFVKWFYEEKYPELGSNRAQVYMFGNPQNPQNRDYWMRQAFMAGARSMSEQSTEVLLDWACAVEGLDPELLEPCEVYDRARENLFSHYNKILDKAHA